MQSLSFNGLKDFFLSRAQREGNQTVFCSHGGNIREAAERFGPGAGKRVIDFSSNVNPFPLPKTVRDALRSALKRLAAYPDGESSALKSSLGKRLGLSPDSLVIGNGSSDLLYRAVHVLRPKAGLIFQPTFGEYAKALCEAGSKVKTLRSKPADGFAVPWEKAPDRVRAGEAVFLCNPNNPTGVLVSKKEVEAMAAALRKIGAFLILDEAFIDFHEEHSLVAAAGRMNNLLVLRSLTKFYGLAGLRLGFAVGNPDWIRRIEGYGQPWPVNSMAQTAGEVLIREESFHERIRARWLDEKNVLYQGLCRIPGLKAFPSAGPFFLVRLLKKVSVERLQRRMWREGLLVRDCTSFPGLEDGYFRVAVRTRRENQKLLRALRKAFSEEG